MSTMEDREIHHRHEMYYEHSEQNEDSHLEAAYEDRYAFLSEEADPQYDEGTDYLEDDYDEDYYDGE